MECNGFYGWPCADVQLGGAVRQRTPVDFISKRNLCGKKSNARLLIINCLTKRIICYLQYKKTQLECADPSNYIYFSSVLPPVQDAKEDWMECCPHMEVVNDILNGNWQAAQSAILKNPCFSAFQTSLFMQDKVSQIMEGAEVVVETPEVVCQATLLERIDEASLFKVRIGERSHVVSIQNVFPSSWPSTANGDHNLSNLRKSS